MRNLLKEFDEFFIELINNRMKTKYLDKFMFRITDLGGAIFSTVFSLVLFAFGDNNTRVIGLEALATLGISQIIVQSLKLILSRERPYNMMKNLNTFNILLKDYSFPSGHTTASFSIATILTLNFPKIWPIAYFYALIIGLSRIYLGVHYPTDVVVGIILGVGTPLIVHYYLLAIIESIAFSLGLVNWLIIQICGIYRINRITGGVEW